MKKVALFPTYTDLYYWNRDSKKRYVVNQGGTSSGKTYAIDQVLSKKCIEETCTVTVVAKTSNALERGALRDFKTMLALSPFLQSMIKDPTLKVGPYIFKNGSILEFVNLNDPRTARHGKRQYLFLNEANTIDYEAAKQLMVRTTKQIFIDYNPDTTFWVHKEIVNKDTCDLFVSNFTHNPFCSKETIKDVYEYREKWYASGNQNLFKLWKKTGNKRAFSAWNRTANDYWRNKWYVYGLGLTGIVEGVIFEDITWVQRLPIGMKRRAYGLDWGFSNDPTTVILAGIKNAKIFAKELVYEKGLTTPQLMKRLKKLGLNKKDLIIADSSNPDAIAQMQNKGWNIIAAKKGPGSVKAGIDALLGHVICLTKDSKNWKYEQEHYKWKKVNGEFVNKPEDADNHLWDALRYWYQYFFPFDRNRKRAKHSRRVKTIRTN